MSSTHDRRWPIRLAKASPLIAAALLVLLAISLPLQMPYALLALAYPSAVFSGDTSLVAEVAAVQADTRASQAANLGTPLSDVPEPGFLTTAARETWEMVNVDPRDLFNGDDLIRAPFSSDNEVYAPITEWEAANDAVVWAWVLTPVTEVPPIVASARGRDGVRIEPRPIWVPGMEESTEARPAEPDVSDDGADALAPWLWRELHTGDSRVPALDVGLFTRMGGAGGNGTATDARLTSTIVADGAAWRCITVFTVEDPDDPVAWGTVPTELLVKDPREPGYDEWLEGLAREHEMDVWVFGPLESSAVPLRVPEGHDVAEADELGRRLWPSWYLEHSSPTLLPIPAVLDDATGAVAGGSAGAMFIEDWSHHGSAAYVPSGGVAAQTIAFLAVFDEMPTATTPGPLRSAWYAWQDLIGRTAGPLLIAGYAFLLVSLVLSPAAFIIDRNRRVRARAAEERERMHRDAHDKVYNRLSALSKRVAEVGNTATNGTAGSLGAIAEDIRYTVGELQQILGDDVEHTSSALADVPLVDQLAAVCGAQAASLGVSVTCDVGSGIPMVSPRLGWDLQCIAEEAITNAVRHGGASHVHVRVDVDAPDMLVLVVTDDGCGTSVTSPDATVESSTGLRGIRDRTARHGGRMDIKSGADGTTLLVVVPFGADRARE